MQIRFEHISKEYLKDAKVLDDVSFEIDAGEFVFLVKHHGFVGFSLKIALVLMVERHALAGGRFFAFVKRNNQKIALGDFARKDGFHGRYGKLCFDEDMVLR